MKIPGCMKPKPKSNYKLKISSSVKKKLANFLMRRVWEYQGLRSPWVRNQVVVILDTRKLLTLFTLLKKFHCRFKTIYIVQNDEIEYAAIGKALSKLKSLLDRADFPSVVLKKGDVFDFLFHYDEKIDYIWIDFEQHAPTTEQLLIVASKMPDLKCFTITLSGRGRCKGGGSTVKRQINRMVSVFDRYMPHMLLNFGYCAGAGPMRLVAFGKRFRECIEKDSLEIPSLSDCCARENVFDLD